MGVDAETYKGDVVAMTRAELLRQIEELAPAILGRQLTDEDRLYYRMLSSEKLARIVSEWTNQVEALVNERGLPEEE